jgi:hypothetical protein
MAHFIITYRIKHDDTYQVRYDSFVKKLKDVSGQTFWNETSSFYAIEACTTAKELCRKLCADTGFECATDAVVVIDTSNGLMATSGAIRDLEMLKQCMGMEPR